MPDIEEAVETAPACEVALAEQPMSMLGGVASIRTLRGMELNIDSPMFAQIVTADGPIACGRSMSRMLAMMFAHDPDESLHRLANEFILTLEQQGFIDGQAHRTYVDDPAHLQLSRLYPATEGIPAAFVYLAFIREGDRVVGLIFELEEGDLDQLRPSMEASIASLQIDG